MANADGRECLLGKLPAGASPNCVALGEDNAVYIAGSALGTTWAVGAD